LPYTLPQDSTLFLVFREPTPKIWLQKLDWIAEHGGLALVNIHPDYMDLTGNHGTNREYAAALYAELLRHVSRKYAGEFWHPLPRELAGWFKETHHARSEPGSVTLAPDRSPDHAANRIAGLRGKRAAVLLYSYYPSDPRPRRAAEAMIEAGMEVDLLCLSNDEGEPRQELVDGVRVFRLPIKHRRDSRWTYLRQYGRFFFASFWFLARRGLRRRYDVVHVHNMPDVLVFSALIPKLRGARVILDLHDPMPELMMTIFGSNERSAGIWALKRLEKWSIGFADAVLTVNEACKKLFSARSGPPEKIRVVMNAPDERIFRQREPVNGTPPASRSGKRFVIMYHGSLVERHGLDLAVTALGKVRPSLPGAELWVFGQETPFLRRVMSSVQNSDLRDAVRYFGPKKLEQIVEAIGECDVGIIPNRRSIFTEINTPTRIFEYLSQAKPVIAPRAAGILDYFGPEDLIYFELGDADDLAAKIEYVFRQPEVVDRTVRRGQKAYRDHSWHLERGRFVDTVAEILGVAGPPPGRRRAAEPTPTQGDP
jgi:glycosyltransferase involved in cell wall biosynthesis